MKSKGLVQMRWNLLCLRIAASFALLALSLAVSAQVPEGRGRAPKPGFIAEGVPEMPNPGPAPKHDLTGIWVGPLKVVMGPFPEMTPAGEAKFKQNKPIARASDRVSHVEPTNDPFFICDPLGFPRDLLNHTLSSRGGIWFQPAVGDRMLILFEQQRVWREVWMDGRALPAKVDAKGFPDSRYYGYSVGHWDGDTTFVIDTDGVDPGAWIDEAGHPHSVDAHYQERWTRLDQYRLEATVTVDDPAYYTKPFQLMKTDYYWMKSQDVQEELCIPSQAVAYRDGLANPSGWGTAREPAK